MPASLLDFRNLFAIVVLAVLSTASSNALSQQAIPNGEDARTHKSFEVIRRSYFDRVVGGYYRSNPVEDDKYGPIAEEALQHFIDALALSETDGIAVVESSKVGGQRARAVVRAEFEHPLMRVISAPDTIDLDRKEYLHHAKRAATLLAADDAPVFIQFVNALQLKSRYEELEMERELEDLTVQIHDLIFRLPTEGDFQGEEIRIAYWYISRIVKECSIVWRVSLHERLAEDDRVDP